MENNNKKYLIGLVILIVGFFAWRYISNPLIVTVTGTGKVTVQATSARLDASVVVTGDTVDQVLGDLKTKVASVRLAMVTGNVNEKNMSQSQIQVTPLSAVMSGAKGYSATVVLYGKTDDAVNVSDLVAKIYKAGASIVSQPVIEVDNEQELENSALKIALDEAGSNARYLAGLKKKMFRKMISVQQASSGNLATSTKIEMSSEGKTASSFEMAKAVSVVYWMW